MNFLAGFWLFSFRPSCAILLLVWVSSCRFPYVPLFPVAFLNSCQDKVLQPEVYFYFKKKYSAQKKNESQNLPSKFHTCQQRSYRNPAGIEKKNLKLMQKAPQVLPSVCSMFVNGLLSLICGLPFLRGPRKADQIQDSKMSCREKSYAERI